MQPTSSSLEIKYEDLSRASISDGLEIADNPHDRFPEVALGQGPERIYESLEAEPRDSKEVANLDLDRDTTKLPSRVLVIRSWRWILVIVTSVIVTIGIVGGSVGGTIGHRSSRDDSISQPPNGPSHLSAPFSILPNTSLAAISCPGGDHWVFFQDTRGSLRAAEYINSSGTWNTSSATFNYTIPKSGTPLGASCLSISPNISVQYSSKYQPGRYIAFIYLDESNAIQQSIYNGGTWQNAPVVPGVSPPLNSSRLSLSTTIYYYQAGDGHGPYEYPVLTSVVVYQTENHSFAMINLNPVESLHRTNVNPNALPAVLGYDSQWPSSPFSPPSEAGLSCLAYVMPSVQYPPIDNSYYQLYTRCYFGQEQPSQGSTVFGIKSLFNSSDPQYPFGVTGLLGFGPYFFGISVQNYPPCYELALIQLPHDNSAFLYMTNASIVELWLESYTGQRTDLSGAQPSGPQIASPITLPYSHFAATSPLANSSTVYLYYQVNETALGEVSFDLNNYTWTPEPQYIPIVLFEE